MCPFSLPFHQPSENFCPENTHPESSLCYFSYDFHVKVAKEKWFLAVFLEVGSTTIDIKIADIQVVVLKILENGEKDITDIILRTSNEILIIHFNEPCR